MQWIWHGATERAPGWDQALGLLHPLQAALVKEPPSLALETRTAGLGNKDQEL